MSVSFQFFKLGGFFAGIIKKVGPLTSHHFFARTYPLNSKELK